MTLGAIPADFDDSIKVLTHEMATPLMALHAALLLLSDDQTDSDALSSAISAANHLSQVVSRSRSLLYGAAAQGPESSIGSLFDEIVSMLAPVISRAGVNLVVNIKDDAQNLLVQTWVIRQVIVNLISNALKYAPGSDVVLSAESTPNGVEISVTDYGHGIPNEFITSVFEPGFRLPQHSDLPGDGLGLAVNVQLLNSVSGTLRLLTGDSGSTFTISIPLIK